MVISEMFEPIAYDLKNNGMDVVELRGLVGPGKWLYGRPFYKPFCL